MNRRTIGANIRYYRKLRGYSQEKLAEMAEINEKLISFYETDSRTPPIFNLIEIASALDVTLDELCGLHQPEPISEFEREVMRVIKEVLRGYTVQRVDDSTQRVDNTVQRMDK